MNDRLEVPVEQAIVDLTVGLLTLPGGDDADVEWALGLVGTTLEADRAGLYVYDHDAEVATNIVEWCREGVGALIDARQAVDRELFPDAALLHREGQLVQIVDVHDPLVPAPARQQWLADGVLAQLSAPVITDGALVGYVAVEVGDAPRAWDEPARELLRTLAELLASGPERIGSDRMQAAVAQLAQTTTQLSAFASAVAHDLKAPLANVHGLLLLARDERLPADRRARALDRALTAAERMGELIDRVLAYASAGREIGEAVPVALTDVVAEALDQLAAEVQAAGATVEVAGELPTVLGDHLRLVEVVTNLVANALVHAGSEPGSPGPRLRIGGQRWPGRAALIVEDDGPGIPVDERERVLRSFERGSAPVGPGSGLGLPICARIAAAHGGGLHLGASALGGLAVTVALPASQPGER